MAAIPGPIGLNSPQDIATALKFGPQTAQALQHSSYLAQALQQLNGEGSQNIHSGAELGAKLIASALLMRSYDKAQRATMGALQGDQQAQLAAAIKGTPLDPATASPPVNVAPQPQAPAPEPISPAPAPVQTPQGNASDQGPQVAPQPSATADASLPRGLRNNNPLNLMGTVPWHNMTGQDPAGYAVFATPQDGLTAADHNLQAYATHHGINTVAGIVNRWAPSTTNGAATGNYIAFVAHQLGIDPTEPLNMADPGVRQQLISAMGHFENGRPLPDFGTGQQVASATPPGSQPIDAPPPAPPADVGAMGMGAQPFAQPAATAPAPQPAPAPTSSAQIPHQVVTPDEWKTAFAMAQDWHTRDIGLAEIAKLKMRAASAVPMKEGTYWGSDNKPHAVEQFIDQPGAPNAFTQRSNLDNSVHTAANPAYGAVSPGMVMGPDGKMAPVPVEQGHRYRLPGSLGWYQNGPDGKPVKVADDAITPKDLQTARDAFNSNEDVKKANEGIAAYNGLTNTLGQMAKNNGVLSTAAIDSYLRGINPGMGARNTTVKMFLDHLGLPTEISAWVQSNIPGGGGGYLTPATLNQMLTVIRQYAGAHAQIAQGVADRDLKAMQGYGVPITPEMLGESLTPFNEPPKVKWLDEPQMPAPTPSGAIEAEIAKRKAAGTWKGR